jgi:hypothetical protein
VSAPLTPVTSPLVGEVDAEGVGRGVFDAVNASAGPSRVFIRRPPSLTLPHKEGGNSACVADLSEVHLPGPVINTMDLTGCELRHLEPRR